MPERTDGSFEDGVCECKLPLGNRKGEGCESAVVYEGVLWFCTRPEGHSGDHMACGITANEHPIVQWGNDDES